MKTMNFKTATTIKPECLNSYSASALTESRNELLNHMELELESILSQEFEGLPSDIYCLV